MARRDKTRLIVVHCSATKPSADFGRDDIDAWHRAQGWAGIGYHFVIRRSGLIEIGRPIDEVGAHCYGYNAESVAMCLIGGLDAAGVAVDDPRIFEPEQFRAGRLLVDMLRRIYPEAELVGHRDLSPDVDGDGIVTRREWLKTCPGFDAREVLR